MAFQLTKADQDALSNVEIIVDGSSDGQKITLDNKNLMFPPIVTKDSKAAQWLEVPSGSFEPFKYYKQSQSRQLGIDFEWITGGYNKSVVMPTELHRTLSDIKAYFYGAFFGSNRKQYPTVTIVQLYEIVPKNADNLGKGEANNKGDPGNAEGATFRMNNIDIKYSKEMTRVNDGGVFKWYPLHVKLSMNLESVSQLGSEDNNSTPFSSFDNLVKRPYVEWY